VAERFLKSPKIAPVKKNFYPEKIFNGIISKKRVSDKNLCPSPKKSPNLVTLRPIYLPTYTDFKFSRHISSGDATIDIHGRQFFPVL
jgi:hypothetical protein